MGQLRKLQGMDIVLLAAGSSVRYGAANKLLLPFGGIPLAARAARAALAAALALGGRVVMVTGHQAAAVEEAVRGLVSSPHLVFVENRSHLDGQFSSTKAGLALAAPGEPFFIAPADLPLVSKAHYLALAPLLEGYDAVRPFCGGVPGHPVLLAAPMRERLLSEPDSSSVRSVLEGRPVRVLDSGDPAWVRDIDRPSDWGALRL